MAGGLGSPTGDGVLGLEAGKVRLTAVSAEVVGTPPAINGGLLTTAVQQVRVPPLGGVSDMATRKSEDNERLIERDLTALARDGKLPLRHGVDAAVAEVLALLTRGGKAPLLAGDRGRQERHRAGAGPPHRSGQRARGAAPGARARGDRRRNLRAHLHAEAAAELFEELLEHLARAAGTVVFIRDVGLRAGQLAGRRC